MLNSLHVPTVNVHLDRICHNFSVLRQKTELSDSDTQGVASWPSVMPVIKADAYGHGHIAVGQALVRAGARAFCSGSVAESVHLREGLGDEGRHVRIVALMGPLSTEDIRLAAQHQVIPVVHCLEHLSWLENSGVHHIALKCDSGMSRLGFSEESIGEIIGQLRKMPDIVPVIVLSHLATADELDDGGIMRGQTTVFTRIAARMRTEWPHIGLSLANSAGALLYDSIARTIGPHVCRPGLALYGCNPFAGTPLADLGANLFPAMEVQTPVVAVRRVSYGCGIGYGYACVAERDMRVAILAAGYADGLSRGLSDKAEVCINGQRAAVLGRVSMQMTAVDVTDHPAVRVGDVAWLLGGPFASAITAEELARNWGTIPYEVMCLLGNNNRRHFGACAC